MRILFLDRFMAPKMAHSIALLSDRSALRPSSFAPKTFLNDFAVAAKRNVLSQSAYVEIYCRFCNVNFYSWQSLFPSFFSGTHTTAAASSLSPAFPIRKIPSTFLSGNKTQNGLVGTMEEFKRMKLTFLTFESSRFSTP